MSTICSPKTGNSGALNPIGMRRAVQAEAQVWRRKAGAASSVLRSKTLKLTGFTPGNLSQIRGPRRIRDSLGIKTQKAPPSPVNGTKAPAFVVPPMFGAVCALGPSVAGRGPRPSPGPLVELSPVFLAVSALSAQGRASLSGGVRGTCPVVAVLF